MLNRNVAALRELLLKHYRTGRNAAKEIGIHEGTLSRWFAGRCPRMDELAELNRVLGKKGVGCDVCGVWVGRKGR